MKQTTFQESAGGIIFKENQVLLIRARTRAGKSVWTFPKGRMQKGEQFWDTALREVREETGYQCRLLRRLKATKYVFYSGSTQIRKTVHWFLLEPIRKAGRPNPQEVVETEWFSIDEARRHLVYRSDVTLLRSVKEFLEREAPS